MKAPRTGAAEQSLPQAPESFQEALWGRHWVRSQVNLENSRPPQQRDLVGLSCGPEWISSRDVVRGQLLTVIDPEEQVRAEYLVVKWGISAERFLEEGRTGTSSAYGHDQPNPDEQLSLGPIPRASFCSQVKKKKYNTTIWFVCVFVCACVCVCDSCYFW